MSQSQPRTRSESDTASPYNHGNWWGAQQDDDEDAKDGGHAELDGADPAEYIAFQELRKLVDPICKTQLEEDPWNGGRTAELFAWVRADVQDPSEVGPIEAAIDTSELVDGRAEMLHHERKAVRLTEPLFYCPKQTTKANGTMVEYRQHRHRRRYNPETGYVNWGETTATGLPQVDEETFMQAVHNYLAGREHRYTMTDEYLQRARRLFRDQNHDSHSALETFIRQVRDAEDGGD